MPAVDYNQLASIYDALVTTDDDVPFFVEQATAAGGPVLELMAGTGRVSLPLARAGVQLTCVDSSSAMLVILERKLLAEGLRAELVCRDAAALDLEERFSLAFIAYNSFSEIVEDADRRALLDGVHRSLQPGGRFICTLQDPALRLTSPEMAGGQRRVSFTDTTGRRLILVLRMTFDQRTMVGTGSERVEDADTGAEILDLPIRFRLTSANQLRRLAEDAGLEVEALYGGYDRSPYRAGRTPQMVWVLRRAS